MPISLSMNSPVTKYLLGYLTPDEAQRFVDEVLSDPILRRGLEIAEEELIAAYVVGMLRGEDRVRFEPHFLCTEERKSKLKFAMAWFEMSGSPNPDLSSPLHRYAIGDLPRHEEIKIEERLQTDQAYQEEYGIARAEVFMAYFHHKLTEKDRDLFDLKGSDPGRVCPIEDLKGRTLRFADIMGQYVLEAQTAASPVAEQAAIGWRRTPQWLFARVGLTLGGRNISRPLWQPLTAVATICLGLVIWVSFFHKSALDRGLLGLNAAYAEGRPIEAWISGFDYAAYRGERRGDSLNYRGLHNDAAYLITSATVGKENKSARECYALGKLYLADGKFDLAVAYLDLARKQDDRNAGVYNDLAVALMTRERQKSPEESTGENYAEASEHLQRAISLNPSLLEPRFNLGLCLEYQMLWRQAADHWKQYLGMDSNSRWAEEARNRLRGIEELIKQTAANRGQLQREFREAALRRDGEGAWQAFRNSRTSLGSFVLNPVIDDYLSARLTGRSADADAALQVMLFIGDFERGKTEDLFSYDVANFYRQADLQQLRNASKARALFKSAAESLGKSLIGEAVIKCQQAQAIFDQIGNKAEALLVRHLLGHSHLQEGRVHLSLEVLTEGQKNCKTKNYIWLLATHHNALRNAYGYQTKYSEALNHNQELIANAERVGDELGVRIGLQGITEIYMFLGRYRESVQAAQRGLDLAAKLRATPNNFLRFYGLAARSYMGLGKFTAALDYQREGLRLSLELNDPMQVSNHYANLGLVLNKLGKHNEAVEAIRKAAEVGRSVRDEKTSGQLVAFSSMYLGHVFRDMGEYENSAKSYQEAQQFYSDNELSSTSLAFETAKGKLLTAMRRGDDTTVAKELERVIDFYEDHRANIEDETTRNIFFDGEQGIYDIAIDFAYSRQQSERQAFDYSELSRARSLLSAVNPSEKILPEGLPPTAPAKPLGVDEIQPQIPDRTHLLQYAALDDKLIIWALSRTGLKSQVVPIGQEKLSDKVTAYLSSLETEWRGQGGDSRPQAIELYRILIEPIENQLDKNFEVCIIPDKILHHLPFAALIAPKTNKYLIEERAIYVSPSANMFLVATDIARRKGGVKSERLLAVGNPDFDKDRLPNLKDLPNAATQVLEAAAFYDAKLVLLNGEARESSIRQEIEKSDIVDFALHYVQGGSPLFSFLPVAKGKGATSNAQDGMIYAHDLYGMKLSRLRVAILSGCETGVGKLYKGEGAISLARAFQVAGVPVVAASLWKVQDYSAKELMIALHKYRRKGGLTTVQALRRAQLDQIGAIDARARSPYHWSAFVVTGGSAGF